MSANPIGLVVIAVVALIAGFVLLYKKSSTFKSFVDKLWSSIKVGVTAAAGVLKTVFKVAIDAVTAYFKLWWTVAKTVFGAIQTAVGLARAAFGNVRDAIGNVIERLRNLEMPGVFKDAINAAREAFGNVREAVGTVIEKLRGLTLPGAFKTALDAVKTVIDNIIAAVQSLIGWISRIDFPDFPDLPGWVPGAGRAAPATTSGGAAAGRAAPVQVVINFNGPTVDKFGTAQQIERLLARRGLIVSGR
jgi:phage-related protein